MTKETWPTVNKKIKNEEALAEKLMNFNSHIWKIKKEKGISLRDKIEGIKIPKELKNFEKDLRAAHSLT